MKVANKKCIRHLAVQNVKTQKNQKYHCNHCNYAYDCFIYIAIYNCHVHYQWISGFEFQNGRFKIPWSV